MKEYEYIIYGIDHFLVDELVAVICQESLECKSYPDGFRRIFDNYKKIRHSFLDKAECLDSSSFRDSDSQIFDDECRRQREKFLEAFLADIEANYPNLGVYKLAIDYQAKVDSDDVLTTEKRVCIYPYLVSQVRHYEEGNVSNGHQNKFQ